MQACICWLSFILLAVTAFAQPSQAQTHNIPDYALLDVGITLFDPGVPENYRKAERKQIYPDVRKAESTLFAYLLRNALEKSKAWGVVRVIPRESSTFNVNVYGKILQSTGERLGLQVKVVDASGRQWFKKTYKSKASRYSYEKKHLAKQDPFQSTYEAIASDMLSYRDKLPKKKLKQLENISKIRFARSLSPEAFNDYVKERGKRVKLVRMVADNDPHYERIDKIKQREHLFIDILDARYRDFSIDIQQAYGSWRKDFFRELLARREQRRKSIAQGFLGVLAVAGGILMQDSSSNSTRTAGDVAILGGATLIGSAVSAGQQAAMHSEGIREASDTFNVDAGEQVLEMEDMTITLTGTIDEQYAQLKDVLRDIYVQETGDY